MRRFLLAVAGIAAALNAGCEAAPRDTPLTRAFISANISAATRAELYFGLTKPGGGVVTDAEWQAFVDREITPRFPAGFSVLSATGQWREDSGKIAREPSRILVVVCSGPKSPQQFGSLVTIANTYCRQFQQEAVMMVTSQSDVMFINASSSYNPNLAPLLAPGAAGRIMVH